MTSDEGLNAYGAATWGQFFIYQGFNERPAGCTRRAASTSVDEFRRDDRAAGGRPLLPLRQRRAPDLRRADHHSLPRRRRQHRRAASFETYRTHHGPIIREEGGKWVAFAMMHKPVEALQQSYPAHQGARSCVLHAGDRRVQGQFVEQHHLRRADRQHRLSPPAVHPAPRRPVRLSPSRSTAAIRPPTGGGLHALGEAPRLLNPPNGWIQNTNNWPYSAAGPYSPQRQGFPALHGHVRGESARPPRAEGAGRRAGTSRSRRCGTAAYDPYLPAFAQLVPGLVQRLGRRSPRPIR